MFRRRPNRHLPGEEEGKRQKYGRKRVRLAVDHHTLQMDWQSKRDILRRRSRSRKNSSRKRLGGDRAPPPEDALARSHSQP